MSHQWVCAKCGTTAYSKCPDARNVFEDEAIMRVRSLLSTQVIPTSNGQEVFLNLTVYHNCDPVEYAFKFLGQNAKNVKKIACDHHWFIVHPTDKTAVCTVDHTHYTNKHPEFRKAKRAAKTTKAEFDYPTMQRKYANLLQTVLDQLEQKSRIGLYPDGEAQTKVSNDLQVIKTELGKMYRTWCKGEDVKPAFSLRILGDKWDSPDVLNVRCNNLEVGKELLALIQDKIYPEARAYDAKDERVEPSLIPAYCKCDYCKTEVTGKAIIVDKKLYHLRCHNKMTKPTTRFIRWKYEVMPDRIANRLGDTYQAYSHNYRSDKSEEEKLTENLRDMLGSIAWGVKLTRFHACPPDTYEHDGKMRKSPGCIFMHFKGLAHEIAEVEVALKTLCEKGN